MDMNIPNNYAQNNLKHVALQKISLTFTLLLMCNLIDY